MARLLLSYGVNVEIPDDRGVTVVEAAASNEEMSQMLQKYEQGNSRNTTQRPPYRYNV